MFLSFFSCCTHKLINCCACVHFIEVFSAEGTKKSVHCSELGGVHYIEVHLQQKLIGGTEIRVQIGGVHFREVFTYRGFTVVGN